MSPSRPLFPFSSVFRSPSKPRENQKGHPLYFRLRAGLATVVVPVVMVLMLSLLLMIRRISKALMVTRFILVIMEIRVLRVIL